MLKLGYRQQAKLFQRAINSASVAAFLIHGLPQRGQQWLLNRLVTQYLPENLNSKPIPIRLSRLTQESDITAFWRDLGGYVGLKKSYPPEIADAVYNCWLTQDVILVFYEVNVLPESAAQEIIEQFWMPLTRRIQENTNAEDLSSSKLLMFLVDYKGEAERWNLPFVEKLDANWGPQHPIKTPKINAFTETEIMEWLDYQYSDLPPQLTQDIEDKVEEILEVSEGGIPELALHEICDQCGLNWYEEIDKWLRL